MILCEFVTKVTAIIPKGMIYPMNKPDSYKITILDNKNEAQHISCLKGTDLLEAMRQHKLCFSSDCGGNGYCGKCRIRLLDGELTISAEDRRFFSEEELKQGWRLACKAYPTDNCVIQILNKETDFDIVTEHTNADDIEDKLQADKGYAIAVDIGTTTVVMTLISMTNGKSLGTYSVLNPQRAYGADVIARIQLANDGKLKLLQELIRAELLTAIMDTIEKAGVDKADICKIAIACNTTMSHLLLGYSCEGLGRYPYSPVNIATVNTSFSKLFTSDYLNIPVVVMPAISTFVGGDIVAGLFACDFDKSDEINLFIDLGTNGELAVGNRERILVSSAAAGPAFEGANISCGLGSVAGAISNVDIIDGKLSYSTIGAKKAVGLCGTGIIELARELLAAGIIDDTGLLIDEYFDEGFPIQGEDNTVFTFSQRDIRQLQMAKAAIRAGTDILIREYGCNYNSINKLYLAGGFGFKLNPEKVADIGLLPRELSGRIIPVGNSALNGAIKYLLSKDAPLRLEAIVKAAKELQLSEHKEFNSLYPEYMYFR